jgi:DNA-binding transcriptional MocR family regulator
MSLPDHRSPVRTADEHRAYIQLADDIREQILDGRLHGGQQIPPIKKLCLDSGFSRQTGDARAERWEFSRLPWLRHQVTLLRRHLGTTARADQAALRGGAAGGHRVVLLSGPG